MVVTDGQGIPLGLHLASAQQSEVRLAEATLATVRVPRPGRGRPRQRPTTLVADRGYDSDTLRQQLRRRGIRPCIPFRRNRRPRRGRKPDLEAYQDRWRVERTFAWLGNYRRLLVRHERLLGLYHGFMLLAFILICLGRISE